MKKFLPLLLFLTILTHFADAQDSLKEQLLKLDLSWEKALLESQVDFLENLLADDFIWVHNHASLIDEKEAVVGRARRIREGQADHTKGRSSRNQKVVILGETAVVSGFTLVDRPPSPTTYHFMRTYAFVDGKWKLLANHTMAVPAEE